MKTATKRLHHGHGHADYFMIVNDKTDTSKIGFIYRISSPTQNAAKVGFAADVDHRFHSLKSGNPASLKIDEQYRCTWAGEKAFHRAFRKHRLNLEWYEDSELIEAECQQLLIDRTIEACEQERISGGEWFSMMYDEMILDQSDIADICEDLLAEWAEREAA